MCAQGHTRPISMLKAKARLVCTKIEMGNLKPTDVSELGRCVTFKFQSLKALQNTRLKAIAHAHCYWVKLSTLQKNNQHVGLRFKRNWLEYSSNSYRNEANFPSLSQSKTSDTNPTPGPTAGSKASMLNPTLNKFPILSSCCFLPPNTDVSQCSLAKPTARQPERWTFYYLIFFFQVCGHVHVDLHYVLLILCSTTKQQISETI